MQLDALGDRRDGAGRQDAGHHGIDALHALVSLAEVPRPVEVREEELDCLAMTVVRQQVGVGVSQTVGLPRREGGALRPEAVFPDLPDAGQPAALDLLGQALRCVVTIHAADHGPPILTGAGKPRASPSPNLWRGVGI